MEQFKYGNVEQTSRKARLRAEATRLIIAGMSQPVVKVDLATSESHGVNLVGSPVAEHGWRVTAENMAIPHSTLDYE